jgi:hypothetical protein
MMRPGELIMRYTLALACLLVATPAAAEPRLLLELTEHGSGMSNAGQPGWLYFAAGLTGAEWDGRAEIQGQFTTSDVGIARSASAAQVALFQDWLRHPDARFLMHVGTGGGPSGNSVDELWRTDWTPGWRTFTAHVPRLGIGLDGYNVTGLTQTLDYLNYTGGGPSGPYINLAQTLRIYGEEMPPPTQYPPLVGDYNKNGTVDAADYVVWRKAMGQPGADLPNAVGGPRPAIDGDWGVWWYSFGESVPPISGAGAVPEPASWLLLAIGLCFGGRKVARNRFRVPIIRWHKTVLYKSTRIC